MQPDEGYTLTFELAAGELVLLERFAARLSEFMRRNGADPVSLPEAAAGLLHRALVEWQADQLQGAIDVSAN